MLRRTFMLLIVALLLMIPISCGETSNEPNESPPDQHEVKPPADENFPPEGNNPDEQQVPPVDPIADQVAQMTLAEKLGQMIIVGIDGTEINDRDRKLISEYKVGGFIFYQENLVGSNQIVQMVNALKETNRGASDIPLFLSVDQEGGIVSRLQDYTELPSSGVIGAKQDEGLAYRIGQILGREVGGYGMNLDFAPVLDVNSNPNNPVIGIRSYHSDPDWVSRLGTNAMKGIQDEHVIAVVKHFPGHGDTSADSHLELPILDKTVQQLEQTELVPFRYAIEQGASVVMVAHILIPKLDANYPSSMSKQILQGLLREELGFDGVIMTDDLTMGAISKNYTVEKAALMSILGGSDIVMVAHNQELAIQVLERLQKAVNEQELPEELVDEHVYRILQLKQQKGLTDDEITSPEVNDLNEEIAALLEQYNF